MRLTMTRIHIPAMSSIGYGYGLDDDGNTVQFAGDHRPLRDIGEAMNDAMAGDGEAIEVEVEDYQVVRIERRAE